MEETKATNMSLSALKDCVRLKRHSSAAGGGQHVVPYRQSSSHDFSSHSLRAWMRSAAPQALVTIQWHAWLPICHHCVRLASTPRRRSSLSARSVV